MDILGIDSDLNVIPLQKIISDAEDHVHPVPAPTGSEYGVYGTKNCLVLLHHQLVEDSRSSLN